MIAELKKLIDAYGVEFAELVLMGWFLKYREDQNQIERNRLINIIEKLMGRK